MLFVRETSIGLHESQVGERKMQFHYTKLIMGTYIFLDNLLSHLLNNSFYPLIYLHLMKSLFLVDIFTGFETCDWRTWKQKTRLNAINYSMTRMAWDSQKCKLISNFSIERVSSFFVDVALGPIFTFQFAILTKRTDLVGHRSNIRQTQNDKLALIINRINYQQKRIERGTTDF